MMTNDPKEPKVEDQEEDPFDALFSGKLVLPVVMDEGNDPDHNSD